MRVCPFLINPNHKFSVDKGYKLKPDEAVLPDVSPHNPGVNVIYITRHYGIEVRDATRGIFVFVPEKAMSVEFWTRGRRATYKEAADALQRAILDNKMMETGNVRELAWRVQELLEGAVHEYDLKPTQDQALPSA